MAPGGSSLLQGASVMRASVDSSKDIEDDQAQAKPKRIYTSWKNMIKHWPYITFPILGNEFCERFCFYGINTILLLYLQNVLKFSANTAYLISTTWKQFLYLMPIGGAIIADGFIGKFKTILSISLVYCAGTIVLTVASASNYGTHPWLDMIALFLIAVGTGGIKPCVAALAGDQFDPDQVAMVSVFFSVFYVSINVGSFIASLITPILRSIACMGNDSCFPIAFGVPAGAMLVATMIFALGSFKYKKLPVKENIYGSVAKVIWRALVNKTKTGPKREQWLDYYLNTHDCEQDEKCLEARSKKHSDFCAKVGLINDIRQLGSIVILFLPCCIYWTLYDQQYTTWMGQAFLMYYPKIGSFELKPDQISAFNGLCIMLFAPTFRIFIYPPLGYFFKVTPLRKMFIGCILCMVATCMCAGVQFKVQRTLATLPASDRSLVSFVNTLDDCDLTVSVVGSNDNYTLAPHGFMTDNLDQDSKETFTLHPGSNHFTLSYSGPNCTKTAFYPKDVSADLKAGKLNYVGVTPNGYYVNVADTMKASAGNGQFKLNIDIGMTSSWTQNLALCRVTTSGKTATCDSSQGDNFYYWETNYSDHQDDLDHVQAMKGGSVNVSSYVGKPILPGKWQLFYLNNTPIDTAHKRQKADVIPMDVTFDMEQQGGNFVLVVTGNKKKPSWTLYRTAPDSTVNVLLQLPQIAVLTASEIFFSVTAYEFAYTQAAPSMKSLIQGLWLLTTVIGDLVFTILTATKVFTNDAVMWLIYAGILGVATVVFVLLAAYYYEYSNYGESEESEVVEEDLSVDEIEDFRSTKL
ncbi:hypothetical protein L596_021663 [Steinernema carpocapsae]|uniref:Major facilitator superfamily (MFS) profile domain-containing protein n=1 Tax=Steinernema carpocapsae TaxID=34508 RepID=A0A4U5MJG7_STECR|nr:hypothetical protein L596_021663 [Steinernema carpocapsae]